jgi:DNA-binding CsgD family transcriptional regulator
MHKKKDAAAVALGRKGGEASARKLTDEQRREKARKAARAKWAKDKAAPDARSLARTSSLHEKAGKLTEREHEVAEYAARGRSNTEIAQLLRIRVNTVKKHIGSALEKLGVANRTELSVVLMKERNDRGKRAPQLNAQVMGSVMLEAAKEAYEMAQYLTRRGQPASEADRNKRSD